MRLVMSAVVLVCGMLVFVARHRRKRETFKPSTLWGVYWDLLRTIPSPPKPNTVGLLLLLLAGIATSVYPPVVILVVQLYGQDGRMFLFVGGIVAIIGAGVNFLVLLLSHMNFGFGVSASHDETVFFYVIPLFQAAFALMSVVLGASPMVANWASELLRNY